jgi:hypothetical protein
VSDATYTGMSVEKILAAVPQGWNHSFLFVIDRTTLSHPDHPILAVDVLDEPGRTFRVIPAAAWAVENNLSLGNMDFAEFAGAADPDGIFRGFPQ